MLKRNSKYYLVILLFLALQLPSYRVLFKFLPEVFLWSIPVFWAAVFCFYYCIINYRANDFHFIERIFEKADNLFKSYWLAISILLLLLVSNFLVYPFVDALKNQHRGSDQDDAIIVVCKALFSGNSAYDVVTYRNNPPSPGPGIVLLLAPFVWANIYAIATPFFIAIIAFFIRRKTGNWLASNIFLLLLTSSPAFWELMFNGSDFLIISCLLALPILLWDTGLSRMQHYGLMVFVAVILSSRVFFIYLIPMYALIFQNTQRFSFKSFINNTLAITAIVSILHLAFFLPDMQHYAPFHLLHKGQKLMSPLFIIGIILFGGFLLSTLNNRKLKMKPLILLWLWVGLPMLLLTFVVLQSKGFRLTSYPLSYLGLQIPIAAFVFATKEL